MMDQCTRKGQAKQLCGTDRWKRQRWCIRRRKNTPTPDDSDFLLYSFKCYESEAAQKKKLQIVQFFKRHVKKKQKGTTDSKNGLFVDVYYKTYGWTMNTAAIIYSERKAAALLGKVKRCCKCRSSCLTKALPQKHPD